VFRYTGIAGILREVCRRMHRYAGLTLLIYYAGIGEAGLPDQGVVGPAYRSRIWPTAISGIQKSTKVSYPYNQGRKHPSMEADYDDRVHSGGLTTITVPKYSPYLTVVRSQSRQVQGTGMVSPIESNQGQSQGWQPSSPCPIWTVAIVMCR
jgi:hypothetical protein